MSSFERAPLLLHSLAEFGHLLQSVLEAVAPRRIVEIGSEEAAFSRALVTWADEHGAAVDTIEPAPTPGLRKLAETVPSLSLHEGLSLETLPALQPADLYVIDGDHNYYTVRNELRLASEAHGSEPRFVAVLHDVGWPCARRDQYYNPDTIPEDQRHPYTYDSGVVPGVAGVVPGGFRGEGEFAAALTEGGPGNGVLTAVEDFMAEHDGWELAVVPVVFGLGILYPTAAPYADELARVLDPVDRDPLLERLEQNRLDLYIRVLDLQDEVGRVDADLSALVDGLHAELSAAHAELHALRQRHGELVEEHDATRSRLRSTEDARARLADALDEVARSRAFRVSEALSRAHALIGGQTGLSRARLRALVDECRL